MGFFAIFAPFAVNFPVPNPSKGGFQTRPYFVTYVPFVVDSLLRSGCGYVAIRTQ
jgi:hypothetical protein